MTELNLREILTKTIDKTHLTKEESEFFLNEVMNGKVSEILLASFLTALKQKGETLPELVGLVSAMRENAEKPSTKFDFDFIDTCGTGGDGRGSFNISTLSAFTLAALGVKVAKHGNRSVSSLSGSSDILQSVGYDFERSKEELEAEFVRTGFVFLFAPAWHPSMKYAGPVRKELGFRTFFNLIGPLSNPFRPAFQVVGVYDKSLLSVVSQILKELGSKRSIICHSEDGLDEFSIFAPTDYCYFDGKTTQTLRFDPNSLPLKKEIEPKEVFADSKEDSFRLFMEVLSGKETSGTDMVALNAGAGLFVLEKAKSIEEGFELAKRAILEKKVLKFTQETLNLTLAVSSLDK